MNIFLGSFFKENVCKFSVWAPFAKSIHLQIVSPDESTVPLANDSRGYWSAEVDGIKPGTRYYYLINNQLRRPDPASKSQPEGVHGASEVVDLTEYQWTDHGWKGLPLEKQIMYELHVGTFTAERDFQGIVSKIDYLKDLGVNTIELMPLSKFPGDRNWGYDGVYPFAVHQAYGGAHGLQQLVNTLHEHGMAVVLDVVYNHMGPEGNYLSDYGPYFTGKYNTPWGKAINFDDSYSDEVRNYFIQNALMWLQDFHIDGLRLDAIHAIKDLGATHFLRVLSEEVSKLSQKSGVQKFLIGECDLNDSKYISGYNQGGYGLDGQWIDEFHHAVHSLATGETNGYYEDFGSAEHLVRAFNDTYVYNGKYSLHRKKTFGNSAEQNPASQFVVFAQNHDQVGNRMLGERLSHLVSFETLKVIAATYLLSPYIPMVFMGEEYAEDQPFLYFVSHTDPGLVEAVRKGRKREFKSFHLQGEMPDPQSEETLRNSSLKWDFSQVEKKRVMFDFYKKLISLRKNHIALSGHSRDSFESWNINNLIVLNRNNLAADIFAFFNYNKENISFKTDFLQSRYSKILDSNDKIWGGKGKSTSTEIDQNSTMDFPAESVMVFEKI